MKKFTLLFLLPILFSCATKDSVESQQKTVQTKVVAVKVETNSTIISSGRLDAWYRIDTPLIEGMIYEVTIEVPRIVKDPIIIPAQLISMNPIEYLQRDKFGRYVTKYRELKSAEKEQIAENSTQK
jgi:hypothetical protein